jgi:dihydropteroate synthase
MTKIIGIVNLSADSFSGDGLTDSDQIINQVDCFINDGIDIIDIGAESTRPNSGYISAEEEVAKLIPIITKIRAKHPKISISVDTYKSTTAKQAVIAGANIINDVYGGKYDPQILTVAKEHNCQIILTHNNSRRNKITTRDYSQSYQAINEIKSLADFIDQLKSLAMNAIEYGINQDKIILDPGLGFGKTTKQNFFIIKQAKHIEGQLGFPLLLGASRKSFIGEVTRQKEPKDRTAGSLAIASYACLQGISYLRVHDVKKTMNTIKTIHTITEVKSW